MQIPRKLLVIWALLWEVILCVNFEVLPAIDSQTQNAIRSQRDLMLNVTIDQLPLVGVNLRKVILNNASTNDTESLLGMQSLMKNGVQNFMLELQLRNDSWGVRDTNLDLQAFLVAFESFINKTDDNLSANILTLHLNISTEELPSNSTSGDDQSVITVDPSKPMLNLTYVLDQFMGRFRIYTPDDLRTDRQLGSTFDTYGQSNSGWPTLNSFLYLKRKRVLITEVSNRLNYSEVPYIFNNTILHYDVGNKTLETPNTIGELLYTSTISWRYLEAEFTPAEIQQYISMGYSPVISNHYSIGNLTQISELLGSSIIWSWGAGEPIPAFTTATPKNSSSLVAYNCALLKYYSTNNSAAWIVGNCYDKKQGLCRYAEQAFDWEVTEADDTYFAFEQRSECHCSDRYQFALPRTPLELTSLVIDLERSGTQDKEIWIDLNSIAVGDCWVTGGPYATCPYQKVVPHRNFVDMITPVSVSCCVILLIVFYLNLLRVPIHSNRKKWRKVVNELSKTELDGVPL
ncbi:hypothetical protein HG536_0A01250 [Torulaspora globosa]|uniref:Maintenance of telomere capping protein 6 n=1 Tax=Torulaspora globosa TaxID=48254 RepID=A0A7G3Z9X2_9SACH|nr:uncharacterized protein HG536_0A01250 [Torulaspora globosa]QLL30308.1 hypothetical protein HG536_0A01250 [Torulaspora globosa]